MRHPQEDALQSRDINNDEAFPSQFGYTIFNHMLAILQNALFIFAVLKGKECPLPNATWFILILVKTHKRVIHLFL